MDTKLLSLFYINGGNDARHTFFILTIFVKLVLEVFSFNRYHSLLRTNSNVIYLHNFNFYLFPRISFNIFKLYRTII